MDIDDEDQDQNINISNDQENLNLLSPILETNEEPVEVEEEEVEVEEEESYTQNYSTELTNLSNNINSYRNRLLRFNRLIDSSYNLDYTSSNTFNRILNTSFYDKSKYKNILSEKGNTDLKKIVYTSSDNLEINTVCPIYQIEFNEGMEIIKLPCNHCFIPEAIEKWLKEEKALCPVCRAKLDSIEIEDTPENTHTPTNTTLFSSLRRSYNYPINNPLWTTTETTEQQETSEQEETTEQEETPAYLPIITNNLIYDIMNQMITEQDETDLQTAIFNSLNNVGEPPTPPDID